MKSYVFGLNVSGDGITDSIQYHVDSFAELEGQYNFDYDIDKNSEFHPCNLEPKPYDRDAATMSGMQLRARLASGSNPYTPYLYHLKSEEDLDRETVQTIIDSKMKTGTLKEFLDNAKL